MSLPSRRPRFALPRRTGWWATHAIASVSIASGVFYGVIRYLMEPPNDDPFDLSLVNHPLEPDVRFIHVLATPLLAAALGWVLGVHALPKLRAGTRAGWKTGVVLAILVFPLILTGPLAQALEAETPRWFAGVLHLGLGIAFSLLWLVHVARALKDIARRRFGRT